MAGPVHPSSLKGLPAPNGYPKVFAVIVLVNDTTWGKAIGQFKNYKDRKDLPAFGKCASGRGGKPFPTLESKEQLDALLACLNLSSTALRQQLEDLIRVRES